MKNARNRLISALLALALAGSPALSALALEAPAEAGPSPEEPEAVLLSPEEPEAVPAPEAGEEAMPFSITVDRYTPDMAGAERIRRGGTYTLIALPVQVAEALGDGAVDTLTPQELLAATGQAVFLGSAVAEDDGRVVFEGVRLRTADAVVYYVTGPGLDRPLVEATSASTYAVGAIRTDTLTDHSATVTLVDAATGYRYGNSVLADSGGSYSFDSVAPGTYDLLVTKPGYLPATRTGVEIRDDNTKIINLFNLSSAPYAPPGQSQVPGLSRVGDVTNDGVRDLEDLAALLLYLGRPGAAPEGVTADLNGDGAVDKKDSDLLIDAAAKADPQDITTGTDSAVTDARLTVADGGGAADSALRYLSFSVSSASTVSAAAFSLTFPADVVQPLNAKGGLVSPVNGGAQIGCLVPAAGLDARLARWSVEGNAVTLTFALTADAPHAAGEVARFYYRPVSGTTADFYDGVFTLAQAAALVGRDTVVSGAALTYPGSESGAITSITIDQASPQSVTIPAVGRVSVLSLSATGHAAGEDRPDLAGLTWSVQTEDGRTPAGVTVEGGLLTVTHAAQPGTLQVTAALEDLVSPPLTVVLTAAPPTATSIVIQRDGRALDQDAIGVNAGDDQARFLYTAQVLDQRDEPLADQPEVEWLLAGAPAGVSVEDGALTFDGTVDDGSYTFLLLAQSQGLQAVVEILLDVELQVVSLRVSGPRSAVVPAPGSSVRTLTYDVLGLDAQGRPVALSDIATLSVSPEDQGVDVAFMEGTASSPYHLNVQPEAQAGEYLLTAQLGDATGELTLTLLPYEAEEQPATAVMLLDGEVVEHLQFTLEAGDAQSYAFSAQLLDVSDLPANDQPERWTWSLSPELPGVSVSDQGLLTLEETLPAGSYVFDLTAADPDTGLAVTVPVEVRVTPVLDRLVLTAPERLTIPDRDAVRCILAATALDAQGRAIPLAQDLVWSVTGQGEEAPDGVTVEDGVLTVTSAAAPGQITVTVSDLSGAVSAQAVITLAPAGAQSEPVLVLYREILVDGQTLEADAPAPAAPDAVDAKVGQEVTVTWSAVLVDQVTGRISRPESGSVKWQGAPEGVFRVDENAESGVYSARVTAVYGGQSATASATVTLYPNITGLLLDFGDGNAQPPYELAVPSRGARYYTATLLAQVVQGGETRTLPISQLGLTDYDVVVATALTGLYGELDAQAGQIRFIVEPAAVQNPTQAPTDGGVDIRFIQLYLDYFPGDTFYSDRLPLYLTPETAVVTTALLRRGSGAGTSFAFGTPKDDEAVTAASGTLSNCYALELLDQYGGQVTGRKVEWTLTMPDALMDGDTPLVTPIPAGDTLSAAYPGYAGICRLQIAPTAPAGGPYPLTLTASCEGMRCTLSIQLTVTGAPAVQDLEMSLSGLGAITIPIYYAQYNSPTVNNSVNTATYTAAIRTASGGELDLSQGYTLDWAITDPQGGAPAGVSVSPAADAASATVTVGRAAQPTGGAQENKLRLSATLRDREGQEVASATLPVELNRSAAVPTLMTIRKGEAAVTSDSVSLTSSNPGPVTRDYTFHLLDQYNDLATLRNRREVKWTLANAENSGVTLTTQTDEEGVSYAHLTVTDPGYSVSKTVRLTASITVVEEKAPSARQTVSATLPISVVIGNGSSSSGGGGGGGGGGGLGGDTGSETDSTPTSISISGNTYLNTTQGVAASQTYTCTLRDASGKSASSFERAKVTWSASGLTSGITFNTTTHVLSVPTTTPAGVYKVILTARYSSSVSTSVTVTVNVANPNGGTPTSISINGESSLSTTQGVAATRAWSATLRDQNGAVVTVPQGSVKWSLSPLTSGALTVTFDAASATLTVPATAGAGTLNTTLTVTYGTLKATLPVTVTVTAAAASPAAPTIVPTWSVSGGSGSATLTAQQEKVITDSSVTGGVITVAPTGSGSLTSVMV